MTPGSAKRAAPKRGRRQHSHAAQPPGAAAHDDDTRIREAGGPEEGPQTTQSRCAAARRSSTDDDTRIREAGRPRRGAANNTVTLRSRQAQQPTTTPGSAKRAAPKRGRKQHSHAAQPPGAAARETTPGSAEAGGPEEGPRNSQESLDLPHGATDRTSSSISTAIRAAPARSSRSLTARAIASAMASGGDAASSTSPAPTRATASALAGCSRPSGRHTERQAVGERGQHRAEPGVGDHRRRPGQHRGVADVPAQLHARRHLEVGRVEVVAERDDRRAPGRRRARRRTRCSTGSSSIGVVPRPADHERPAVVDAGRSPAGVGARRLEQRPDVAHVVGPVAAPAGRATRGRSPSRWRTGRGARRSVATGGHAELGSNGGERRRSSAAIPIGCSPPEPSRLAA